MSQLQDIVLSSQIKPFLEQIRACWKNTYTNNYTSFRKSNRAKSFSKGVKQAHYKKKCKKLKFTTEIKKNLKKLIYKQENKNDSSADD